MVWKKKWKRRCNSICSFLLAFIWALLVVCSDDVLVYADGDFQESPQLSSMIQDVNDTWMDASTDFVLQDANALKNRLKNNSNYSRVRLMQSVLVEEIHSGNLNLSKKYIVPLEIDEFFNEKMIMNYIHRQDGDK